MTEKEKDYKTLYQEEKARIEKLNHTVLRLSDDNLKLYKKLRKLRDHLGNESFLIIINSPDTDNE